MSDNPTTMIANARIIAAYYEQLDGKVATAIITNLADALEAAEAALREIQFLDCCYDCRIVADRALGEADDE